MWVGGSSRCLAPSSIDIRDTMLGRLVSDAWQEDPEEAVFIDRNGDTFAYVLDYLRYGSIDLPITVPKATFDREIDYYGIRSVEGTINGESIYQVADSFHSNYCLAKRKHDMFFLAMEAHNQHWMKKPNNIAVHLAVPISISNDHKLYRSQILDSGEKKMFKEYLTKFGLRVAKPAEAKGYRINGHHGT
ncbi:hypothetical protein ACHAWF_004585, partial [Thalassiosira exigua]